MGNRESTAGGQTAIPVKETYVWYRKFMMEYPSGLQTLHEFKTFLGLQGLNQKANQHVDQVYNTFDMNKAVQNLSGQQSLSPEEFTNLVFHKIDINRDGELTLEEFINSTEKDQDLLEIVSKSFDFSSVLRVICHGRQLDAGGHFLQTM
ncbi:PREDICTED: guanylyl cyclase-activating protein 3 [Hipposideros armiger]|uniref:Guanylyl cyclase-activating protein 3 n=1 Tax=Hipposideros armiger TaxID=186990 RepID=A0A8B7S263_HIPAR|nr:PREDICTED: guanylyl cyclase-activating protein 3 [Hipposideros armiger]